MDVVEEVRRLLGQAIGVILDTGEVEHQFLEDLAAGKTRLKLLALLACLELERKHRAEQFANGTQVARQQAWAVVVAGDQAPELAGNDDRDRHRGVDPHITQVFAVNGRDIAQDGVAHVERRTGARVERRDEQRGVVIDLGDQPQPGLEVQRACLERDVSGGVMEIEERREFGHAAFGNHPPGPIGHEAVDHHAVILGNALNASGRQLAERVKRDGFTEALDHDLHGGERIGHVGIIHFRGLEFDDKHIIDAVRTGIERAVGDGAQDRVEKVARLYQTDVFAEYVEPIDLIAREQRVDRSIKQVRDRTAQERQGIPGRLKHP